jgi:pyruvate formate lyase activating enzyme
MNNSNDLIAKVHSIETCGTVDGPGLRYIAFFQGCNLRCKYCHNPDTWGINSGTVMTVPELLRDILKYESYMKFSGGGFTASGGEPLLQAGFIANLFKQLKQHNVHTAIDTSGHTPGFIHLSGSIIELFEYTDLVLLDIKSIIPEKYRELTAVDINPTKRIAEYLLKKNIPIWLRYVVVPDLTDCEQDVQALAEYLTTLTNIERVELQPFHKMGEYKWAELNLPYSLTDTPAPDEATMQRITDIFKNHGLPV